MARDDVVKGGLCLTVEQWRGVAEILKGVLHG